MPSREGVMVTSKAFVNPRITACTVCSHRSLSPFRFRVSCCIDVMATPGIPHRAVRDSGGRHDVDTTGNAKAERGKGSVGANGAGGDSRVYKGLRRHHNPFTGRHPPPLAEHRLTRIPECIDLVLRQPATAVPLLRPRVAPHVIAVLLPESRQVFLE